MMKSTLATGWSLLSLSVVGGKSLVRDSPGCRLRVQVTPVACITTLQVQEQWSSPDKLFTTLGVHSTFRIAASHIPSTSPARCYTTLYSTRRDHLCDYAIPTALAQNWLAGSSGVGANLQSSTTETKGHDFRRDPPCRYIRACAWTIGNGTHSTTSKCCPPHASRRFAINSRTRYFNSCNTTGTSRQRGRLRKNSTPKRRPSG